jgi:hypothetical protein
MAVKPRRAFVPRLYLPGVGLALAVLVLLAEGAWMAQTWRREQRGRDRERRLEARIVALQANRPAPTERVAADLAAAGAELEQQAAASLDPWQGPRGETDEARGEGAVHGRTGAFFDLAWFVEDMRATAAAQDVRLAEGEQFGFASHVRSAPAPGEVDRVLRQRFRVESLLHALFAARPERLESVRRERPDGAANGRPRVTETASSDLFTLEPRLSVRRKVKVDTLAFRLVFTGTTECLRRFVNEVASGPTPWLIRLVEVEPAVPRTPVAPAAADPETGPIPVINAQPSRFVVLLESFESLGDLNAAREGTT